MFEVGRIYRRTAIHNEYGGQGQGGISTPAKHPFVFLFSSDSGEQHGYRDGWSPDGTYTYTGEGQEGDMKFDRGNAAVRDHVSNGEDLHLFQYVGTNAVRYEGQMVCAGYQIDPARVDSLGHPRKAIQFHLVPLSHLQHLPDSLSASASIHETQSPYDEHPHRVDRDEAISSSEAKRRVKERSDATRRIVLERAHGRCEACGQDAPFIGSDGKPYLEPHHVRRMTDGGPDDPAWVIALCPNCHRHAHHGIDREAFTAALHDVLRNLGSGHSLQRASQP